MSRHGILLEAGYAVKRTPRKRDSCSPQAVCAEWTGRAVARLVARRATPSEIDESLRLETRWLLLS